MHGSNVSNKVKWYECHFNINGNTDTKSIFQIWDTIQSSKISVFVRKKETENLLSSGFFNYAKVL